MQKYSSAFGKNDIRGIYGNTITEELYEKVGRAYVEYVKKYSKKSEINLSVCRDARLHSKSLTCALIKGLLEAGANVIDLGLAPTPIGYYSEFAGVEGLTIDGALIVTASHNPPEYNGLKMTYNYQTLNESQIQEVKDMTFSDSSSNVLNKKGTLTNYNLIPDYIQDMKKRFGEIGKNIKVVVDSANATGGIIAPQLYRDLGCEVVELFSEPDGTFPNHHPNPSDIKTLDDIKKAVIETEADIGIAFDGDSDRIGVIDSKGNPLSGDKLLLIYAKDIIDTAKENNNDMPKVVSEVKCSQVLYDKIDEYGGKSIMCKTGHGFIKTKMKETGAILAGEMSGHTFFKDTYYGFDDAIYAGCRIIDIIAKNKQTNKNFKIEELLKPFENVFSSQEVRLHCPDELKKPTLEKFKNLIETGENLFDAPIKNIITLDGLRIVFKDGFALIRQSNTEPVFTLRFEASNEDTAKNYENTMINTINKLMGR